MNKHLSKLFSVTLVLALMMSMLSVTSSVKAEAPSVYLNEIQVSTSSTDWEFFELQGDPGTDLSNLTLLGIESDFGSATGRIDVAISLSGQSIPADGFWLGMSPAGLVAYGVDGELSINDNSFENGTATYFLVNNFTGSQGDDLDGDDNGVLDSTPWDDIVDAINIRDSGASDFSYGVPSVGPDGSFLPSGTYRCPDAPSGSFGSNILNFSTPNGTPGKNNRSTCGLPEVYINEIQVSTTGSDWEFFELAGTPGTDLSAYTLVELESDVGSSTGRIDLAISLSGQSIPADGFWLGMSPAGLAAYGVAGDMTIADNSFENSTASYFLVRNFTAAQGDDLDSDDNGVLDSMPWDFVLDSINIRDSGASDFSYGAPMIGPDGSFLPSGAYRCPDAPDGLFNTIHNFSTPDGTPGVTNGCGGGGTGPQIVKIHDVQGNGLVSPLDGQTVAIEGIVVGDFQDDVGANGDLNGFFVQEEDADADTDPLTSEGVFVFQGSNPTVDVAIGDLVRVEGSVSEYFGDTQITSFSGVTVNSSGNPLPTVSVLSLPVTDINDFEAYEGMYVTFPQPLVISEYFNFDRFGEIVLTDARHFQPTAVFEPGSVDAANLATANSLARITLDDGRTNQNPDPAIHPNGLEFNLGNLFRGGDTVTDVTGVINYSFGLYRVQPTQGANYTSVNPRTASPDPVGGNVSVASFNVLNYFTTLDDGSCPYSGGCRGADNAGELTRQRDKIIAAIAAIDADVVGLMEIENHPSDVPVADLVSGLNDVMGTGTYDYIATGAIGSDAIRQAFIYKPANVSPVGAFAALDTPAFLDPNNTGSDKNRPALAQTFSNNSTGAVFTVVVNHLKSKGSGCGVGDDDPEQGSCNLTRTMAAQVLVNWLATDPTNSNDEDFMIIGDLNSYDKEDPIDVFINGGYTDLAYQYQGEYAYSYVFSGQWGYLDYALANAAILNEVTGATEWHINADEADLIDYDTSFKGPNQDAIYAPDAYRASDHDPVIVGLELTTEAEIYELIGDVQELVGNGTLNDGQGNALTSKLENILAKLANGNTNAAANQLGAFINQVEAFVNGGTLTAEQGDAFIKSATLLVEALD